MATGISTDSSNGRSGGDDGSLTVAQIRAPSTPLQSDMNPVHDFPYSGRQELATVKNVEEIIKALDKSFNKFIETQRSYLDRQRDLESSSESSSESSNDGGSSSTVESGNDERSADSGLTEATVSDIIKAVNEKNEFIKNEIQESLADFKSGFSSKVDSINSKISEKLIESSQRESSEQSASSINKPLSEESIDEKLNSFVDYMVRQDELKEKKIDELQKSVVEMSGSGQKNDSSTSPSEIDGSSYRTSSSKSLKNADLVEIPSQENKGILGHVTDGGYGIEDVEERYDNLVSGIMERMDAILDTGEGRLSAFKSSAASTIVPQNDKSTSSETSVSNASSIEDVMKENERLVDSLRMDVDGITKSISGMTDGGMAESMVELMVENSMMQMMVSDAVEGLGSTMLKTVDENFGDAIRTMGESIRNSANETMATISSKNESVDVSANGVDAIAQSQSAIITEGNATSVDGVESMIDASIAAESNTDASIKESTEESKSGLIERAFDGFMSMFKRKTEVETTYIDKPSKKGSAANAAAEPSDDDHLFVSDLSAASQLLSENGEDDENEDFGIRIDENGESVAPVETETPTDTTIVDSNVFSREESIKRAIARAHLDNESVLDILDSSNSDTAQLLQKFDTQLQRMRDMDSGVAGLTQLGDVSAQDLYDYYMSGREERMRSYTSAMSEAAISSENENTLSAKTPMNDDMNAFTNGDNGGQNGAADTSNLAAAIENGMKYLGERFDTLEKILSSAPPPSPPQMIYLNTGDSSFGVDRIG